MHLLMGMWHHCNECIITFFKIIPKLLSAGGSLFVLAFICFYCLGPNPRLNFELLTDKHHFIFMFPFKKPSNFYQRKVTLFENVNSKSVRKLGCGLHIYCDLPEANSLLGAILSILRRLKNNRTNLALIILLNSIRDKKKIAKTWSQCLQ